MIPYVPTTILPTQFLFKIVFTLHIVGACFLNQFLDAFEMSIPQELCEAFIVGRLHEVDAVVADPFQRPNVHNVADAIVGLIGHPEIVLKVTLEALTCSFLDVPDEIALAVNGGKRNN